jgi:hypothetical protein
LPTAFAVTAVQFSRAVLRGRVSASYVGSVLLLLTFFPGSGAVSNLLRLPTLGRLLDPVGFYILSLPWTMFEKNTRLVSLQGSIIANRLLWIGVALGVLAFTYRRFRFADPAAGTRTRRETGRSSIDASSSSGQRIDPMPGDVEPRTFGPATRLHQVLAIGSMSFRAIARRATGLALWVSMVALVVIFMPLLMELTGIAVVPRTADVLALLTAPVANNQRLPWPIIPLLIVFYAGELVWRERDARLSAIVDTTPVPEWVFLLGKFLGLALVLMSWMMLLTTAGVLGQLRMGYAHVELGLYLRALFGLQLVEYLLFAVLAMAVHVVVNHKHVGYLATLVAYGVIAFASRLGIDHKLLVYGSSPGWTYSDMRGFGGSLAPWLWFKVYWAGGALLGMVVTALLWVRGSEQTVTARLLAARRRFNRSTGWVAAAAVALITSTGGFIFYNTNVLHAYVTDTDRIARGAEYERRYGRYDGIPQPRMTTTTLRVDIWPERRRATIAGTYRLVNDSGVPIDAIHVATAPSVRTGPISFDRPIARTLEDNDLGHRIYTLVQPLLPGDTTQLHFDVTYEPRGFTNGGIDAAVVANGTSFTNRDWLPAIGYQRDRELRAPGVRAANGLPAERPAPSLDDPVARRIRVGGDVVAFDAVVGTSADQIAVAPGRLRRTWTEAGRRYFHYVADVPINNEYGIFSAAYATHDEPWSPSGRSGQSVAIEVFHAPGHAEPIGRMMASVRASLDLYTRLFGPYPYSYLRLIETPGRSMGVETEAATIHYGEGFSSLKRGNRPQDPDPLFAVIAHGVARGWWGMQVVPAAVEGSGLLTTSLETYSGMRVVEETLGLDQLRRYVQGISREYDFMGVRSRSGPSLLRATDGFAFSRGGPFALYAVREYIGTDRLDEALRQFFQKHRGGTPPLPTSMDLYREIQAVTPDSLQSLLHDLFEANTYWDLETTQAAAVPTAAGAWRLTLDVQARKVVIGKDGAETEVPMDDVIEVGVVDDGASFLERQRVHSGRQTIVMTVPQRPTQAGIDPRHLLSDSGEIDNNIVTVKVGQ